MAAEYAVYKGEETIATGTVKELAKKLGVKETTIYYYAASKRQKNRPNGTVAVRVN